MMGMPDDARAVPRMGLAPGVTKAPPARRSLTDLGPRVVSALILIALALAAAWLGGAGFALFWLVAAASILFEWQRMVAAPGTALRFGIGATGLALVAWLVLTGATQEALAAIAIGAPVVGALSVPGRRVWAAGGLVYAGAILTAVLELRYSGPSVIGTDELGLNAILWLFAVVWSHDVMAYFGGRLIGGPKLWPRISPSKTWAGTAMGIVSGAFAGAVMAPVPGSGVPCFILGFLCALAAGAGDIFESAVKRRFGLKDSSHVIPGHGGVMDRLDGFAAAAVLAALVGVSRHGFGFAAVGLFYW
jgi:phosphatidate cytidylyltransferase